MTDATGAPAGESGRRTGRIGSFFGHPLVKVVLYYAALAVGILLVRRLAPELYRPSPRGRFPSRRTSGPPSKG